MIQVWKFSKPIPGGDILPSKRLHLLSLPKTQEQAFQWKRRQGGGWGLCHLNLHKGSQDVVKALALPQELKAK